MTQLPLLLSGNPGEFNGMAKLTNETVQTIRHERDAGATYDTIATRYGVSRSNVHQICTRKTWRHLPPSMPEDPTRRRTGRKHGEPGNMGESNGQARLTPDQVWAIRAQREAGDTYAAIASRFDVSYSTVWEVCNLQSWWHLRTPPPPALLPQPTGRYVHVQSVVAVVWTVVHNLGFFPQRTIVVDVTRRVVYPGEIEHLDIAALVVRFSQALAGEIYCS